MFAKEKANILQSHALRNHESNDLLHKSESTKELIGKKKIKKRSESVEVDKIKQRLRTDEVKSSKMVDKLQLSGESGTRNESMKPTSHFQLLGDKHPAG